MNTTIAKREIDILTYLNNCEHQNNFLVNLIDYIEDRDDIWIVCQKGGKSFTSLIFKIKGEFLNNERIYNVKKGKFLTDIFDNINHFKFIIRRLLEFLKYLEVNGIIHCDIKPDNILISYSYNNDGSLHITDLKVIDFGSALYSNNPEKFSSNTPEYMSPEINDIVEKKANSKEVVVLMSNIKKHASCIDMWSLGVSILEIALACPLWMNYKAKVVIQGKVCRFN
jgi:serine/threonine protein kinase